VGTTALILTKLDEAPGFGHTLAMLRASQLPLSYLTNGQNVPADIETAEAHRVAQLVLNAESS
jgi:flagellar biosynthesis protein FlhF